LNDLLALEPLVLGAVLLALSTIGLTALRSCLLSYAVQTGLLGALAIRLGVLRGESMLVWVGAAVIVLKALGVPLYLSVVARRIGCRSDDGLVIAPPLLMFGTVAAVALLVLTPSTTRLIPRPLWPSMVMVVIGMLFMMTRRMAVSQILGFLMLENGIFVYGVGQPHAMPIIVELGVLVDVLAGTMLSGLLVFRISDTFEHADIARLKELQG
jgi:hydrogenase-4 component E